MKSDIFKKLEAYLMKEQFNPSITGLFLNPFYFSRKALYDSIKRYSGYIKGQTLDIGCGSKPYEHLFVTDKYTGLDTEVTGHNHKASKIDIYYDGVTIPFENSYFDSIVCFEVLEVVFNPELFLNEAFRVLKNGGTAIFTVPFIWDESEQPYDYARYSSFGLRYLFEKHGFNVIENRKLLCDLRLLSLLSNAYIYKIFKGIFPSRIAYFFILPLTTINNFIGHIFCLFPKNPDLYFGNIFILRK